MARRYKRARPKAGETEFTGRMGRSTSGIPEDKPASALSASDQLRLSRITDPSDKHRRFNQRIWDGETPTRTKAQIEGDRLSG